MLSNINPSYRYTFSGQTTFNYDDFVRTVKKSPIVRGFDMQNYSPHNPWSNWQPYDDGTIYNAINWYLATNRTGIVTFFWHWFSPMGGQLRTSTFYTNYTDFDVTKAVIEGTAEYIATLRDIDAIAIQLLKLQNNNIPILWRPLHEAGGKWFWWGAKTSTAAIALYRLLFDRLISYHNIHNLIWIWSTPEPDWYPGDTRVDILSYDSYPGSYNYTCEDSLYYMLTKQVQQKKLVMMTENGPIPNIETCMKAGIKWGIFMGWNDLVFSQNTIQHILDVYNSPYVITLENVPNRSTLENSE